MFLPTFHSLDRLVFSLSLSLALFSAHSLSNTYIRLGIWFTLHQQLYQELEWFSLIRINWVISHFGSDGYELGPSTKPKYYRYICTWFIVIASKWNMRKQSILLFVVYSICQFVCLCLYVSILLFCFCVH